MAGEVRWNGRVEGDFFRDPVIVNRIPLLQRQAFEEGRCVQARQMGSPEIQCDADEDPVPVTGEPRG